MEIKTYIVILLLCSVCLGAVGDQEITGDLYLKGDEKKVYWYEGTNYLTFRAPSTLAANYDFTWPVDDGTSGQALITDGSGVLSFSTPAGMGDMLKATYDNAGGAANSLIDLEAGGLEADVSAYSGLVAISGGATAEIDALSELEGQIAGVTAFVVEGTACSDIEGTGLSITTGTLNWSASGIAGHDSFTDFVANEHIDHTSVTLTAGTGLSGGGDISANRTFAVDLTEMTGNVVWDDGSTDASITWTYALSGATDPVWTIGDNSMDLTTGVLKVGGSTVQTGSDTILKDLVTTTPLTGGTDDILPGADADITLAITVLKDVVTTAPLTGGTDDILPGADSDITLAITVLKDIVAGTGLSGGADDVLPGTDADVTLTVDATELTNLTWAAGAASFTHTFDASAGTDCVWTYGDGTVNLSTGALQVGGSAVLTAEVDPTVDTEAEIEAITGAYFGASKAVTSGYIWVADGTDFESVVMSGDVTIAAGGATSLANDTVAVAEFLASQDWGDMSTAADGTVSLDADVVAPAEMADADHGDFTYSTGTATLDTDSVADNEIDYTAVNMDDMTDGSTNAAVTLTQETNWDAAYTHVSNDGSDHSFIDQSVTTSASPTFAGVTLNDDLTFQNAEVISNTYNSKLYFMGAGGTNNHNIIFDFETYSASPFIKTTTSDLIRIGDRLYQYVDIDVSSTGKDVMVLSVGINTHGSKTASAIVFNMNLNDDVSNQTGVVSGCYGQVGQYSTTTTDTARGILGRILIQDTGTITTGYSMMAQNYMKDATAGTLSTIYGFYDYGTDAEDGTVTSAYNFYGGTHLVDTGTLTNAYGIYLADQDRAATTNVSLYSAGGDVVFVDAYSETIGGTNTDLYIDDTGLIGPNPSSIQFKENIRPISETERIYQLNPILFDRKDGSAKDQMGLIAEEVAEVMPEAVSFEREIHWRHWTREETEEDGTVREIPFKEIESIETTNVPYTVNYSRLIVPLLAEVQKLRTEVDELKRSSK